MYTVPGPIDSTQFMGSNDLIAQGAQVLHSVDAFIGGLDKVVVAQSVKKKSDDFEASVMSLIPQEGITEDALMERHQGRIGELKKDLLLLEMSKKIVKQEGTYFRNN